MKKVLALALVLVLAMALLAGCSGAASSSSGSTSGGGSAGGSNILRMGISSIGGVFNPIMADQVYDQYVNECLFDFLVDNNIDGEYTEDMGCATWELSEDKLTYTFTLKDGIAFWDGTPMTAEDVAFTFTTMADPDYDGPRDYAVRNMVGYEEYHSGEADTFAGIQVIDDKTISFTFQEGQASPANVECFNYGILSKAYYAYESWEDFVALNDQPMGSGRLMFDSWALNEHVTMSTNPNYWNPERALQIDGVVMLNVPEDSMLGALSTGEIDFGQITATQENYDEAESMENISVSNFMGNGYTYMQFNCTRPKLADVRVRQALIYAMDRQAFIDAFYGPDLAEVGMVPISPASWAYPSDPSELNTYDFDMEKAAALMDEAGWLMGDDGYRYKDGEKFSITWLVYEDSPWPAILSSMAYDTWTQLGVDLVIEKMDFITVQSRTSVPAPGEKDFDIYTMGFSLSVDPNPEGALYDADAYTAGGFNASGFRDERSQELIQEGKNEFDQDARALIYEEWAIRQNELVPTVIIANRHEIWGISNNVNGLVIDTFQKWTQGLHNVTFAA